MIDDTFNPNPILAACSDNPVAVQVTIVTYKDEQTLSTRSRSIESSKMRESVSRSEDASALRRLDIETSSPK